MSVEEGYRLIGRFGEEPGGSANSAASCSWVDGDFEGGWPVQFVNAVSTRVL